MKKMKNLIRTLFFRIFKKKLSKAEFTLAVEALAQDPTGQGLVTLKSLLIN